MIDYEKLTESLKKAAEIATPMANTEDGGTCNLDSLELVLPRYNETKTLNAIKKAGLIGHKSSVFGTTVYLVIPPVCRQGNARTRQAETMRDVMESEGFSASVWYQMD